MAGAFGSVCQAGSLPGIHCHEQVGDLHIHYSRPLGLLSRLQVLPLAHCAAQQGDGPGDRGSPKSGSPVFGSEKILALYELLLDR
jgi:hypothetical protein